MIRLDDLMEMAFVERYSVTTSAKKFKVNVGSEIEVSVLYFDNSIEWTERIRFSDVDEVSCVYDFFKKRYESMQPFVCRFYDFLLGALKSGFKTFDFSLYDL